MLFRDKIDCIQLDEKLFTQTFEKSVTFILELESKYRETVIFLLQVIIQSESHRGP